MKLILRHMTQYLLFAALLILTAMVYSLPASAAPERWIVVGDETHSIVSGAVKDINRPDLAWPSVLQAQSHHQIINLAGGTSGYRYLGTRSAQQIQAAILTNPTGVILAFGTWDWLAGQDLTFVRTELRKQITLLRSYNKKVVCLTPPYRTDSRIRKPDARGWTLNPIPSNLRITYATAIAAECALQGAGVIFGFNAPIGLAHVGPLNTFTRGLLLESGHALLATFVRAHMMNLGHLPPL